MEAQWRQGEAWADTLSPAPDFALEAPVGAEMSSGGGCSDGGDGGGGRSSSSGRSSGDAREAAALAELREEVEVCCGQLAQSRSAQMSTLTS